MALYDCVCCIAIFEAHRRMYPQKEAGVYIFVYLFLFIFSMVVVVMLAYNGTLRENVKVGCFRAPDNPISFFLYFSGDSKKQKWLSDIYVALVRVYVILQCVILFIQSANMDKEIGHFLSFQEILLKLIKTRYLKKNVDTMSR